MKNYKRAITIALTQLSVVGLFGTASLAQQKQPAQINKLLPLEAGVKVGKLSNGFTYFIRRNGEPKQKVEMYLVNKVGSILEDDDQQGLAHFMEHMNFNGTKHYPKNELVNYLQKAGVRFGADLNAYTGFDETVYQLPITTNDPAMFPAALQILRDWAQDATLDSIEIEKERGIILEEKRLGKGARDRMSKQTLPMLLNHSLYSKRLPIGQEELLKTFPQSALCRFHQDWYRPDLQALIIVGDVDVAIVEEQVKKLFGDLKNPSSERPRTNYEIPLGNKTQFIAVTDPEVPSTSIEVMYRKPIVQLKDEKSYLENLKRNLAVQLLAIRRFSETNKIKTPSFLNAGMNVQSFFNQASVLDFMVVPKPGMTEQAFLEAFRILERVKRYGFTQTELDNGKKAMMSSLENALAEKSKTQSAVYAREYQNLFLYGEAVPGLEWENTFVKVHLPKITLEDLKGTLMSYLSSNDINIVVAGPEKNKAELPTLEKIQTWMSAVGKENIELYVVDSTSKELLANKPKPGKVVSKQEVKGTGTTLITLSNGVKVALKPTKYKNDEVLYGGFCLGGTSNYSGADYDMAVMAPRLVAQMGFGGFSPNQLIQVMNGKNAGSSVAISDDAVFINAGGSARNIESALQLTYLQFTSPKVDESVFRKALAQERESLKSQGIDPNGVFNDTIKYVMGNHNYRFAPMSAARLNALNLARTMEIYRELLSDASGFSFSFVGNFTVEGITPLIEQYLGSLPATGKKHAFEDNNIRTPQGIITKKVFKGTEDKASVKLLIHGGFQYSAANNLAVTALGEILEMRMLDNLREKEGEVYSPSLQSTVRKEPENRFAYMISFGCLPKNVDHLISIIDQQMAALIKDGPTADEVQKFKMAYQKTKQQEVEQNGYWLGSLMEQMREGTGIHLPKPVNEQLDAVTVKSLQASAAQYMAGKNKITFELLPVNLTSK